MVDIIKNTFSQLKLKGLIATPDNYFQEFKVQAKVVSQDINECKIFDRIINDLTSAEQVQIKEENITSFSQLALFLTKQDNNLKNFSYILDEILAPSIHNDVEKDIHEVTKKIAKNPKELLNKSMINKIKNITKKRITNDRNVVINKSQDIKKLTSLMGKYFDKTLLESGNSSSEISNIKDELETLSISPSSAREVGLLQSKLVTTIYNIEHSMEKSNSILMKNKSQFNKLQETIEKLHEELENAKEENKLDYLTNILNRRSFDRELYKIERKYKLFDTNYAIVFYDLDKFKDINDTYGHDCGDAILRTFAGVLNALTREEDILARYGGEEFVVLLNYDNEKELTDYLKRVKDIVNNRDFKYQDKTIELKFSAGLARRNQYQSNDETLVRADKLLFQAKNEGRDRIILDNGIEIID